MIALKIQHATLTALTALLLAPLAAPQAADLPRFEVPGHEADMKTLNELHALHHDAAFTDCTLWDGWPPMATLCASEKTWRGQI